MIKRKINVKRFLAYTLMVCGFISLFPVPKVFAIRMIDITGKIISHPNDKKQNVLIFDDSGKNKYFKSKVVLTPVAGYCRKVCRENLGLNLYITDHIY